jgi:hypothetical protein
VQRDIHGDRFDSGAFREAALALVSQPDRVSRQEG